MSEPKVLEFPRWIFKSKKDRKLAKNMEEYESLSHEGYGEFETVVLKQKPAHVIAQEKEEELRKKLEAELLPEKEKIIAKANKEAEEIIAAAKVTAEEIIAKAQTKPASDPSKTKSESSKSGK